MPDESANARGNLEGKPLRFLGVPLRAGVRPSHLAGALGAAMFSMFGLLLNVIIFQDFLITRCGVAADSVASTRGYLTILQNLTYLCTAPLWGLLSDRFGRRPVGAACFASSAVCFWLLGAARSTAAVAAVNLAVGFFVSGGMSSAMAAGADYAEPKSRGKLMGIFGTLIGVSISLAMLVGFLSYRVHPYLTFALQGVAYLGASATALALLRRGPPERRPKRVPARAGAGAPSDPPFLTAKLLLSFGVAFLLGGGMMLVTTLYLPWGELEMGLSRGAISAVSGSTSLLFTLLVLFAGIVAARAGRLRMIFLGLVGYAAVMAVIAGSDSAAVVSGAFVTTALFLAMVYPTALDFAASLVPPWKRGLSMGLFHGTRSGGELVFLLVCPFLYENAGGKAAGFLFPFALASMLALFAAFLRLREGPHGKFPEPAGPAHDGST